MAHSAIENATIAIQNPDYGDPEVESNINYSQESVSRNGERMWELGSAGEVLTKVELDLAYSSEKLVNLDVLLIHVAARESDFEAITVESDDVLTDSVEKAMEFNLLSGILDSEVMELDNFMEYLAREIVDARQKIYSCEHLRDAFPEMEEKLHNDEESLKRSKDQVSELRMQSAKFQRTLLAYSGQENWNDGKCADFSGSNQFSSRNAKLKMQTAEQQRHILRMLEKSLARELDLEKKLSESRPNEEMKLKLHSMEHEVFCREEAEDIVWERLLEAENTAEVLMGIAKEMMGQLNIILFNLNSSIKRESEADSKLKDSMEQLSAKEIAFQKLESSSTELDNFLLDQTSSLKASLKEAEDKYILANSEAFTLREKVHSLEDKLKESEVKLQNVKASLEASQEENSVLNSEISEMEHVIKDLKKYISEAESKAESAEAKCLLLTKADFKLNQELSLLKSTGSNTEKMKNLLEEQLNESEVKLQNAKASLEASQEENSVLNSEISEMENVIKDLKIYISEAESKAESADAKCVLLTETGFKLNQELGLLKSTGSNTEKINNSLEEQLKESEVNLQNVKAALEASQKENSVLNSEISEMENVIMDLKTYISEAESKAESAEAKCVLLTETGFKLNQELGLLKSSGNNTEKIKNSLEEQLKESEVKIQDVKAALEASQEENSVLNSEISEMENVIKDLKKNISEAESKAECAEAKCVLLTETDFKLKQELGLLKSTSSNREKTNFLEKQLREADIQLQHEKASAEASQEQQNLLYSTIQDMDNLIGDMKSKVSKAKSSAESAEAKCILLSETNMELNEELNFLRGRIESLESSLRKADNAKVATAMDISIRTKVITDLVMQLASERERIQKQISSLISDNKYLVKLLRTNGVSVAASNGGNATNKEPSVSEDDLITTSMESSATGFQVNKSLKEKPVSATHVAPTISANNAVSGESKSEIGAGELVNSKHLLGAILSLIVSFGAVYLFQGERFWVN